DVLGRSLEAPAGGGSALGAAFAAGIGTGVFSEWEEITRFVSIRTTIDPDPAVAGTYEEAYATYRELYPALRSPLGRDVAASGSVTG
ncbi:MAG: hypothetical protein ACRDSN_24555, partial [Pseudonocardiaceae bacterium]